jgi:hypothetical protein
MRLVYISIINVHLGTQIRCLEIWTGRICDKNASLRLWNKHLSLIKSSSLLWFRISSDEICIHLLGRGICLSQGLYRQRATHGGIMRLYSIIVPLAVLKSTIPLLELAMTSHLSPRRKYDHICKKVIRHFLRSWCTFYVIVWSEISPPNYITWHYYIWSVKRWMTVWIPEYRFYQENYFW